MCQKHILDAVKYNGSFLQTSRWLLILRRNSPLCEHYYSKMKVSSGGQQHKMFYSNADYKTKSPLPTTRICPYDMPFPLREYARTIKHQVLKPISLTQCLSISDRERDEFSLELLNIFSAGLGKLQLGDLPLVYCFWL